MSLSQCYDAVHGAETFITQTQPITLNDWEISLLLNLNPLKLLNFNFLMKNEMMSEEIKVGIAQQ